MRRLGKSCERLSLASLRERLGERVTAIHRTIRLAPDRKARLRVWLVYFLMAVKTRVPALHNWRLRLRLRVGAGVSDVWVSDRSELNLVEAVLAGGEYGDAPIEDATVILDIGANIGLSALWFRAQNPRTRIICVEPDPSAFAKLRRNVGGDVRIECVHAAITQASGPTAFRPSRLSWISRVAGPDDPKAITVPGLTLDDLVASHQLDHIDLLKVDIEGMEWRVLPDAKCLASTDAVIGEIHPDEGPEDTGDFLKRLARRFGMQVEPTSADNLFLLVRRSDSQAIDAGR